MRQMSFSKTLWQQISFLIVLCLALFSTSAHALMVTGNGYDINSTIEVGSDVEFVGVEHRINFDIDENHLTLTNAVADNGLIWVNYGKYVFSGFENITNVYIESNNKFHGTTVWNYKWDNDSITLNMNLGWYDYAAAHDQQLTFFIERDVIASVAPVPEPSTVLLFGAGLIGLAGTARRRRK